MESAATDILWLLFLVATLAGCLDTLAGGGGLITVPALMLSGISPIAALATNKLQGTMGTATATCILIKQQLIQWHQIKSLLPYACLGSAVGTLGVQFIDGQWLGYIIPAVLAVNAIYFMLANTSQATHPKISNNRFKRGIIPIIGAYDGALGPGTGAFFTASGTSLRGLTLLQATVLAKPLNFATNIASLGVFVFSGHIMWLYGLVMMAGQALGATLGSKLLVKLPYQILRGLVLCLCIGMLIKFLAF